MSDVGALATVSWVAALAVWLVVSGVRQPSPSWSRVIRHLDREPDPRDTSGRRRPRVLRPLLGFVTTASRSGAWWLPTQIQLRLIGRPPELHAAYLVAAAFAGVLVPVATLSTAQAIGVAALAWYVPAGLGLALAAVAALCVHASAIEAASGVRADLRHELSAYLDLVSMLLAGNSGYEGALEHAAAAGDGRLFVELRRRMREASARGASLTDALAATGRELGLDELEQVAATAALSAAEGAPVVRTLAAKCATLRAALMSDQEAEARLRTSRLTTPIVGMALIFMTLVIFPALQFS